MTQNSKYSSDVEAMAINDGAARYGANSWERERSTDEIKNFLQRRFAVVGELDAFEYEVAAV